MASWHYQVGTPALTRGNTECDTTSLRTPLDGMGVNPDVGVKSHITSQERKNNSRDESYFKLNSQIVKTPTRQPSAKALISRYEGMSMASPVSPNKTPQSTYEASESALSNLPPPLSALKMKDRSPLRDSFRNLISLFGKKGNRKDDVIPSLPYDSGLDVSLASAKENSSLGSPWTGISKKQLSVPLRCGPVLYLSPPISDSVLPVWTDCNASLHQDHILLEWKSAQGNPLSSKIPLSESKDVRSVTKSRTNITEKQLLPDNGREAYLFEIIYADGSKEKFALYSVAERSSWVTAIWDTLLQLGQLDRSSNGTADLADTPPLGTILRMYDDKTETCHTATSSTLVPSSVSFHGSSNVSRVQSCQSNSPSTHVPHMLERESEIDKVTMSPVSILAPLTPSEASKSKVESSIYSSRMLSPSIRNLSDRSIVRSRLAQISTPQSRSGLSSSLSRKSTIESRYSVASSCVPNKLATPDSSRRYASKSTCLSRHRSQGSVGPIAEHLGNDFYAQRRSRLSSISLSDIDVSRAQVTRSDLPDSESIFDDGDSEKSYRQESTTLADKTPRPDVYLDDVQPLIALVQDHAVQQYSQTSDLGHQIASLQNDILRMSEDLRKVISQQDSDSVFRDDLQSLCDKMERACSQESMKRLIEKISMIHDRVILSDDMDPRTLAANPDDVRSLMDDAVNKVTKGQTDIQQDLSRIFDKLGTFSNDMDLSGVAEIKAKLDVIIEQSSNVKAMQTGNVDASKSSRDEGYSTSESKTVPQSPFLTANNVEAKLEEVLVLVKKECELKKGQGDQQVESVRYLHELNAWLETFVNNGNAQIQTITQGVQALCEEFIPKGVSDIAGKNTSSDSKPPGLRSELQKFIVAYKAGEEERFRFQTSVFETLEELKNKKDENKPFDMNTIIGMIDRHRQEQEVTLRGIATDLSNDIRGERLRFVEAMKEATAINVQVHVEEFKKELGREVMAMTNEVSRLQRERQMLEQQIADLFAFFAKQRAEMQDHMQKGGARQMFVPMQPSPRRANSQGRPLPFPK